MTTPLRVLVVDDEPNARAGIRALLQQRADITIIGECGDGDGAINAIRHLQPDLVLLDIQMPARSGLDVIQAIGVDQMPATVFVTAHQQHAIAAFEAHALDYLLKPFSAARLHTAIDRAITARGSRSEKERAALRALIEEALAERAVQSPRFAVRIGTRTLLIDSGDVEWIDGAGYNARLHVDAKAYLLRESLADLEARLDPAAWIRVHRSALVRLDAIRELHRESLGRHLILLRSGAKVPISRNRWPAVSDAVGGLKPRKEAKGISRP